MNERAKVIHGDCIEVMQQMEENSIDAIVTDPPYGLGFMGKKWDELPPGREWAEECLRVLKPGGHILAFGGTRTWHRLAVAVEDAGFEIRDSIAWLYASGFPKAQTSLKPAFEPIIMGRKPFKGSLTANLAAHGTGPLNINESRLGGVGGRWPTNIAFDESQASELDKQSGMSPSNARKSKGIQTGDPFAGFRGKAAGVEGKDVQPPRHDDAGGASRFFYVAKAPKSERPSVDNVAHPTVKPLTLMRHLVRLVTPEGGVVLDPFAGSGTTLEAATLEGFQSIGIEAEADYLPLIHKRLERTNGAA